MGKSDSSPGRTIQTALGTWPLRHATFPMSVAILTTSLLPATPSEHGSLSSLWICSCSYSASVAAGVACSVSLELNEEPLMPFNQLRRFPSTVIRGLCTIRTRLVRWSKPDTHSPILGTVADLARGRPPLVAENLLRRQQLIVLNRPVKRPRFTDADGL